MTRYIAKTTVNGTRYAIDTDHTLCMMVRGKYEPMIYGVLDPEAIDVYVDELNEEFRVLAHEYAVIRRRSTDD